MQRSGAQLSAAQLSAVAQQAGANQFAVFNPFDGPHLDERMGGSLGDPSTPSQDEDPSGFATSDADPTGALSSIAMGLARFYGAPVYNMASVDGLSDTSYQYQTGSGFGANPMLRRDERMDSAGFGAAGDGYTQLPMGATEDFRVWGYGAYSHFANDRLRASPDGTVTEDFRQDGDSFAVNLGGDYRVNPDLLVGVSLGFTRSDVDLTFNNGSYTENLFTVAPYALQNFWQDRITVGVTAGYGVGLAEIATAAGGSANEADTSMIFTSLNLSGGDYLFGTDFSAEGTFNYTFIEKELDAFLSSNGTQNPVSIAATHDLTFGGELRYDVVFDALTVQPFVSADLIWQMSDTINNDPVFGTVGGGFRLLGGASGFAGRVEATQTVDRSDFTQTRYEGSVSYTFGFGPRDRTTVAPFLGTAVGADRVGFRTGLDLASHNDAIGASLSWSQDRPRASSGAAVTNVLRLDAELRF